MEAARDAHHAGLLPKSRLEAFSDGVIAIIITILVLEVKVPQLSGPDFDAALLQAFAHSLPLMVAYAVTFVTVLVFWVAHHHLLHSLRRLDRNFLWLNGFFLLVLAFVPVPTALIGAYPQARLASVLYGGVLTLCGMAFFQMRVYASRRSSLQHEALSPQAVRQGVRRSMLSPALYAAGTLLGFVDVRLAWAFFLAVPLIFIVPGSFDRNVHRLNVGAE